MITVVVDDYDAAIDYYTTALGFTLVEDTKMSETKRWVVVAPDPNLGAALLLAQAATPEQSAAIGNQSGGRVMFKRNKRAEGLGPKNLEKFLGEYLKSPDQAQAALKYIQERRNVKTTEGLQYEKID